MPFENVFEVAIAERRVGEEGAHELGNVGGFKVDEVAIVEEEEDIGLAEGRPLASAGA